MIITLVSKVSISINFTTTRLLLSSTIYNILPDNNNNNNNDLLQTMTGLLTIYIYTYKTRRGGGKNAAKNNTQSHGMVLETIFTLQNFSREEEVCPYLNRNR